MESETELSPMRDAGSFAAETLAVFESSSGQSGLTVPTARTVRLVPGASVVPLRLMELPASVKSVVLSMLHSTHAGSVSDKTTPAAVAVPWFETVTWKAAVS